MTRELAVSLTTLVIFALAACSDVSIINAYDGPMRPDSQVAVLFTPKMDANVRDKTRAVFSGINGQDYGTYLKGYPLAARVPPGQSMVKVLCYAATDRLPNVSGFRLISVNLEAGHYYELTCDAASASCADRGSSYSKIRSLLSKSFSN